MTEETLNLAFSLSMEIRNTEDRIEYVKKWSVKPCPPYPFKIINLEAEFDKAIESIKQMEIDALQKELSEMKLKFSEL